MAASPQQLNIPQTGDKRLTGGHTIVQWAHDVLTALGLPTTQTNIAILVTWANIESGGYNPNASGGRNNPLNTTQPGHGGVGGGGQGNIMDYPSYADGVAAIVENLRNPRFGYPNILAGLRAQNPSQTFAAINASSFGTHISPNTSLTLSGITGINPAPDSPSGHVGYTTNAITDAVGAGVGALLGPAGGIFNALTGGALKTVTAPFAFFVALSHNWRYFVEIGAGLLLIGAAIFLLGKHTFEGRAKEVGEIAGPAAKAAAVAA